VVWHKPIQKLAGKAPPFEAALPLLRLNRAVARFTKGTALRAAIDYVVAEATTYKDY